MNYLLHFFNPVRAFEYAVFLYKTRNWILGDDSKHCYRCHRVVGYDTAETCTCSNCPMITMPF
ncbi:MAG: hypothetical protein KME64_03950 [Scytonematopsis contorta HA4267-MV1]|nr:hypothetical protein [Scytonematopsis contorta HA4267-MV1]